MASDNPPYFQVGTNVSARYKGAFCSACVKKVKRKVKVKLQFACQPRPKFRLVMDDEVFGPVYVNATVRAMDPDKGGLCDATVVQVIDRSVYTVVFNDGDVSTLSRSGVCTPGQRHYNAKDSLDNFPLLDPKVFSTPVMAGSQQVPTARTNRRLSRSVAVDSVVPVTPEQDDALNLTVEGSNTEDKSTVVRSCRQKHAVASSSKASVPTAANRPKLVQRKKNTNGIVFAATKQARRKVLGYKRNAWRKRKMNGNSPAQQSNGYRTSKLVQPKMTTLTDPAILKVIDGIKQGRRSSSILRLPIRKEHQLESPVVDSSESLLARALLQGTQEERASKRMAFSPARTAQAPDGEVNEVKETDIRNLEGEKKWEGHEEINGSDQVAEEKAIQVSDSSAIDLKPVKTETFQEELPCCSKTIRKNDSSAKGLDVYHRRNTRSNAARAFPTTVNDMYKELCVIVKEKKVEVPTTPPVGKQFNFIPENLELVTDPKERQRMIMTSMENLCVTYFGIKEHLAVIEQLKPKKK